MFIAVCKVVLQASDVLPAAGAGSLAQLRQFGGCCRSATNIWRVFSAYWLTPHTWRLQLRAYRVQRQWAAMDVSRHIIGNMP